MSCALVPFGRFQDLEAARDFLCPHRRQGSAAAGRESGESGLLLEGELGFGPAFGARWGGSPALLRIPPAEEDAD
uniref:Uncharacterized protein n=1 Tax=Pavo cristatus TaxID=9049 RepID=A0A8C9LC19_PAVCR